MAVSWNPLVPLFRIAIRSFYFRNVGQGRRYWTELKLEIERRRNECYASIQIRRDVHSWPIIEIYPSFKTYYGKTMEFLFRGRFRSCCPCTVCSLILSNYSRAYGFLYRWFRIWVTALNNIFKESGRNFPWRNVVDNRALFSYLGPGTRF